MLIICVIFGHTIQHAGSQFPNQGSQFPYPLHWEHGLLTTGLTGSPILIIFNPTVWWHQVESRGCTSSWIHLQNVPNYIFKSHSRKHFMLPCKMCTTFFKLNSIVTILLPAEPLRGYRKHTVKAPFTRTDNLVDSTVRLIVA